VLIILPPSESKRQPPDTGPCLDLRQLSFPELNPLRRRMLDALRATSSSPDALRRLLVGPALIDEVLGNTVLDEVPTRHAVDVYSGPLYKGLDAATLTGTGARRLGKDVVIASSLWGLLRPNDPIPTYRLHVCARLDGLDRLEPHWRKLLPGLLASAAGESVVVDLRSPVYQSIGKPTGAESRTVVLKVGPAASQGGVGDVVAKRTRGEAARHLLESRAHADEPEVVGLILGERWPARTIEPHRPNDPWTVELRPLD
jgi:cytoplasmic iron level regulating protein YaaA (DUF328/UPF0246 family)